ncbi:hypothetical protein QVN60_17850 [Yersinia aleksiciae]|uniref:hypothetical protein n=1 Tax=Yersinia aleksiciae TaxID=263819 RepID=UPI0025AB12AB|nr:hypothetical protein [Yersinia aleksiciae]MDN0125020.1 hypothetical protein [Yersinia aleksiciae]
MLNIKSLHFIFILSINYPAFAINQVNLVYRADSRAPEEFTLAGGMFPFPDLSQDPDLLHHFEGESLEGYTSVFVSTTASLRQAINHAAFTTRMSDAEPFDPEHSTSAPYLALGVPRGYVTMAQNETGRQLPISVTCYGEASFNTSRMKRGVIKNNCRRERIYTSKCFYNNQLIWQLFNLLVEQPQLPL